MITGTTARVSHYHVQKQRRAEFMSLWRANQRAVIHVDDVVLSDTARGSRQGVYLGAEGGRPTRTMDVWVHEIEPGAETTVHRHSWDALVLCVGGWAWTEVDGQRISWGPGDSLHLPAWAWHRHGNEGDRTARFLSFSCEPLLETMGMAILQEAGRAPARDLPGRPSSTSGVKGDGSYELRVRRLAGQRHTARLHTSWDDLEMLPTPRGTRSTFLVDRSIDYQTSGLTMALFEIAPGRAQSMHRHPGEAWLYVLDGRGYSYLGAEPEGGIVHAWKKGDLIVVDHFLWHQHFKDSPQSTARVVRVHMFDSLLETMRALCDPLILFEEPPDHVRDAQAGDATTVEWPPLTRPTFPSRRGEQKLSYASWSQLRARSCTNRA